MQDLYTTIEKTALAFVSSIGEESHEKYLAPGFETTYGPLQQEIPLDTSLVHLDNLTYKNYYKSELDKFSIDSNKRLLDSSVDPKKRKAWLWYQLELQNAGELLGSPYEKVIMEVMWLIDLTEDGKKVLRCRQYLDTIGCDAFFPDQADAAQASFPTPGPSEGVSTQESLDALTAIDERNAVEDFLKGLSVSRS